MQGITLRRTWALLASTALLGVALAGPATAAAPQPLVITDVTATPGTPSIHCLMNIDAAFTGGKGKSVTIGSRLWLDGDLFGTYATQADRTTGTFSALFILPRRVDPHDWQFQVAAVKAKGSKIEPIGDWSDLTAPYTCPALP